MSTVPGQKSRQPKRSRIVVNVEELQPRKRGRTPPRGPRNARARSLRWLVPLGVIAFVLLAFLVGTYVWWQAYKSKPAYALALVLDAARRNDAQTFEALVDVDSVSRSLVPQVVEQMRNTNGPSLLAPQVRQQIALNAPILLPGARDEIRTTMMTQIRDVLARSGAADDSFIVLALGVSRVVEIKQGTGDTENDATATLTINGRPVELDLQRTNDAAHRTSDTYWRVVGIKSDELATRAAETLGRVYPAGK
jgi:Protein of unknown function (DUF2939)